MPKANQNPAAAARELADLGFNVLPAGYRKKAPTLDWKKYQSRRTDEMLNLWFTRASNYWIMTGKMSGVVVLDIDNPQADAWWREQDGMADLMDATTCVRTSEKEPGWFGHHYYFKLEPGESMPGWAAHPTQENPDVPSFDVRGDGGGVIAPPSIHESGVAYEWVRGVEAMLPVPDRLRRGLRAVGGDGKGSAGAKSKKGPSGSARSMLAKLLADKPTKGGRNEWMAKVAGHLAKQFRTQEDAYRAICLQMNHSLAEPLGDAEFNKTVKSIWESEHENHPEREVGPDTGYLQSGGDGSIKVRVKVGESFAMEEWADFDLRCKGVVDEGDEGRAYDVDLIVKRSGEVRATLLDSATLADGKKLEAWCAGYGVAIMPPDRMNPLTGKPGVRLTKYLMSQGGTPSIAARALGWNDQAEGFVTKEELITAQGRVELSGVRPHPNLTATNRAPYRYGFVGVEEARRVLGEVMSFQEERVCAVFGAWWAAGLVRPQLRTKLSLFPVMLIEGTSGSGKTTGFFELMSQLGGSTAGPQQPTRPVLRDLLSAHRSGFVWMDDLNEIDQDFQQLIRVSTTEGAQSKMGIDNTRTMQIPLLGNLVITGEGLGFHYQKALIDRAVMVNPSDPSERRSLHNPEARQWDDVLALREQYPSGLSAVAGDLVALALAAVPAVLPEVKDLRPWGSRSGDKLAVLRAGARILDEMLQTPGRWAAVVDAWVAEQPRPSQENTLTLELLPACLAANMVALEAPSASALPYPGLAVVIGQESEDLEAPSQVWFNPRRLAEWAAQNGQAALRTTTKIAIEQQCKALHEGRPVQSRQFFLTKKERDKPNPPRQRFWLIEGEVAQAVIDRARGDA